MSLKPFEYVVREHGSAVLRVCRAMLGHHEAEDAWAETFLAALRAYPDLDPGVNVEAWLITIAKRKCIDEHRATTRRPTPVGEIPDASSAGDGSLQEDDALWSALQALPMRQREAVVYHHLAGLPYAQVGAILGNSEAAARRAAADGLKKLRAAYRGEIQGAVG